MASEYTECSNTECSGLRTHNMHDRAQPRRVGRTRGAWDRSPADWYRLQLASYWHQLTWPQRRSLPCGRRILASLEAGQGGSRWQAPIIRARFSAHVRRRQVRRGDPRSRSSPHIPCTASRLDLHLPRCPIQDPSSPRRPHQQETLVAVPGLIGLIGPPRRSRLGLSRARLDQPDH